MIKYTHLIKFLLRDKMYSYNIEIEFDLEISSKNYTLIRGENSFILPFKF